MSEKKQIGKILLRQRALTAEQLDQALREPRGGRLASRLAEEGTITDVAALKALSEQHGIPGIDLNHVCLKLDDLDLLPREIAEKHLILPVLVRDDRVFIAMANPREKKVIDELEFVTGKKVYPYVALETSLSKVIEEAYQRKARGEQFHVGPLCPPEVRRQVLETDAEAVDDPAASPRATPLTAFSEPPLSTPGVVVDDQVGAFSRSDEVGDEGFGELSRELSVVSNLPPDPRPPEEVGKKTVLVVDDEADIRKMLRRLLEQRGYGVLEADRGLAALKLVKEHAPALIVLDAMLPEVHGFDIARRIKGSQRYGAIPIIMVSAVYRGWRYAEDLKISCGVDYYIEKPFRISEVLRAVEACLERLPAPEGGGEHLNEQVEAALAAGVEAYRAGRLKEAIEHQERGRGIDPLAYRLHFHLGLLYGKAGRVYDAIRELETAVDINSRHFSAVKNLAVLYQKAGFRNKATEMWQRALNLAPDEPTRKTIKEHLVNLL